MVKSLTDEKKRKKRGYEIDAIEAEVELAIAEWEVAEPFEMPPNKRKENKPKPQVQPRPD
ncbi:hypothetical protein M1N58_00145 [Dehalococcoidales bacterium]|nr:hypothetical protein [Dehalococcoidales bacterium]MCL0094299.1 hypothetical protein [Dehalococcoidales bacterium]